MMIKYLSVFLFLVFSSAIRAQQPDEFPCIRKNDLPGIKITRTRSFNGESLYGYINGGADLFLEYGFRRVDVTELIYEEKKYKIEVWQMSDGEAAFGIFSVSRHRCLSKPSFAAHSCLNRYQLQLAKGEYYVSIINDAGTPADTLASLNFAKLIDGRIGGKAFDPDSFIAQSSVQAPEENLLLVRGRLGILNGNPDLEDYFKDITDFTALISPGDNKTNISVRFNNIDQMLAFCKLRGVPLPDINSVPVVAAGQRLTRIAQDLLYIEIF